MSQKLLLAVVFLIIAIYSCPANYQIPNLQAGSAVFQVSQKTSYVISSNYDHQFLIPFSSIPSVSYSIHNIVINGPLAYQWAIKTNHITTTKLTIRFKYQPLEWTFVKCGFLVAERKDIILGSITSNFESLKQNSHIVTIEINQPISHFNSSVMRVFMSGFTMKSGNQYYIRAFDKSISQKKIQIGVQVAGTMQITSIQLNYIIFSPRLSSFASYGGGQNQVQLNQSKMYNIERNIYHSPYKYYGVGHIRHSGQNQLAFLTEIDDNFYLRLDSLRPVQQIYVAYIILGVPPAQFCSNCNQLSCAHQRACVNECPFDSYLVRYQDGGKGCRRCPTQYNMVLNPTKNGCDCLSGYVKKRGHCLDGTSISPVIYMSPLMQKLMKIINNIQYTTTQSSFGGVDPFQSSNTLIESQQTIVKSRNIVLPQQVPSNYNIVSNIGGNLQRQTILNSEKANNAIRLPQNIEIIDKNRIVTSSTNLQDNNRVVNFNANQQNYAPIKVPPLPVQTNMNQYATNISPSVEVSNNMQISYVPAQPVQINTQTAPTLPTIITNTLSRDVQYSGSSVIIKNQNTYGNQSHMINSYSPNPSQQTYALPQQHQQTTIISQSQGESIYTQKDCTLFANTYWTGYRCACKVGFSMVGSVCSPIRKVIPSVLNRPSQFTKKLSALVTNSHRLHTKSCKQPNQMLNGQACICVPGCNRNERGICIKPQQNLFKKPIQRDGKQYQEKRHEKQNFIQCNQYSYRNSSGQCVCLPGYVGQNGNCIQEVPIIKCGPNSYQQKSGKCVCEKGYHLYEKLCLLCPSGQVAIQGICQHVCGANQISKQGKCVCKQDYCRLNSVCQRCPTDYFNIDGYCVTCPYRTVYNPQTNQCVCQKGYILKRGVCEKICTEAFQQYCEQTNKCKCIAGLSRIENKCVVCQSGVINPLTQQCINDCRPNEIRIGNRCACKPQYGYGPDQLCMKCSDLPGGFLMDGYCTVCPENLVNIDGKCGCPNDKKLLDHRCVSICSNSNQIMDHNGFCYVCPVNQQPENNRCVCKNGFERVNNICVTKCPANSFQINGICGYCAMNTQYCPVRKVCVCPDNYYVNNDGACEHFVPTPIECLQGQFYSSETKKCQSCGKGCISCEKLDTCRRCSDQGYYPFRGMCIPKCGDGLKLQTEHCDDGNNNNYDGCSQSCEIEPSYTCIGTKPSKCTKFKGVCGDGVLSQDQQCDDKNMNRGDGCYNCLVQEGWHCISNICSKNIQQNRPLPKPTQNEQPPSQESAPSAANTGVNLKQVGDAIINSSNVFVILECPTAFKFSSERQMKSFMKYRFLDSTTQPKSAYCIQRTSNQKLFDCLNVYPSGLPNKVYKIVYSYDYQGQTGQATVQINPLKNSIKMRSLK